MTVVSTLMARALRTRDGAGGRPPMAGGTHRKSDLEMAGGRRRMAGGTHRKRDLEVAGGRRRMAGGIPRTHRPRLRAAGGGRRMAGGIPRTRNRRTTDGAADYRETRLQTIGAVLVGVPLFIVIVAVLPAQNDTMTPTNAKVAIFLMVVAAALIPVGLALILWA